MSKLHLYFNSCGDQTYLQETLFISSAGKFRSIRGRSVRKGYGTFELRNGIYALQRLFVSFAILRIDQADHGVKPESECVLLEGGKGSLASSLDYAINKPPKWLIEMFGATADGSSFLHYLLKRENTGLVRPEPVRFLVRAKSIIELLVFVNGTNIRDKETLTQLLKNIPGGNSGDSDVVPLDNNIRLANGPSLRMQVKNAFIQECKTVFSRWNMLHTSFLKDTKTELLKNKWNYSLINNFKYLQLIDEELTPSLRVGHLDREVIKRELNKLDKIEIFSSVSLATLVITDNIRNFSNCNIFCNNSFSNGYDICHVLTKGLVNRYPEACILTVSTGAHLINSVSHPRYIPVFFTPPESARILSSKPILGDGAYRGPYMFFDKLPSGPSRYYDSLHSLKKINKKNATRCHMDDHEIASLFKSKDDDIRAIQWFPISDINRIFNDGHFVDKNVSDFSLLGFNS